MTNLGLPVPPGFVITTEACKTYLEQGNEPPELAQEVTQHLTALENAMGKKLGQTDDPLLVSVRSGAKFSMPGMMDTVLNIGLNDESVTGLAKQAGNDRFAWDSYRRLIQMFGKTVMGVDGDYLQNAQGEDVVAGIRNTVPLADLEKIDKPAYDELMAIMSKLENHYKDLCDIEFTIERNKLWMLQTRVGKRTAAAAFKIAIQLVDEGLIDMDEALNRVNGAQLAQLMFPRFDDSAEKKQIAKGINASPGAAVGKVVFDSHRAAEEAAKGEDVILVRRETNPDDLPGMIAAKGILTSRGGKTSHAAVVARGMGKTCVSGADDLDVDVRNKKVTTSDGTTISEGDVLSIDGTSGAVYLGEVPVVPSPVVEYFEGNLKADAYPLVAAVDRLIQHADGKRKLGVRANSD